MPKLYITTVFPNARRVQLSLLEDKYGFTKEQLKEIEIHWIKDAGNSDCYTKPSDVYTRSNPQSN